MICDFCVVSGFTEPEAIRKILSNTSDEELFKQYLFFHRLSDISTYAFPDDFPFDFDAYSAYVSGELADRYFRKCVSEEVF